MATEAERLRRPARRLNAALHANLDEIYINGSMEHRLPHNLNISFAYVEGESLLMGINDVAVSSGSACTSASLEPSYVLKALGAGDDLAHSSIRFGLGRWTHRGRSRLRRREADERRAAAARDVAALRDGERRRRPVEDAVGDALRRPASSEDSEAGSLRRSRQMAYSNKVIDHYENPRNVGLARQGRRRTSARGSSARPSAAT